MRQMRIVLFSLLILPLICFSQGKKKQKDTSSIIKQPNRIEFEIEKEGSEYHAISAGSEGLMVLEGTGSGLSGGNTEWKAHLVDTSLNVQWTQSFPIPADGSLIGYDYFKGRFYLLFRKNRFRTEELLVLQFNIFSQEFLTYDITTVFPVDITFFESVGEIILLAGYTNFRPVVITYDINDKIPRVVPGFYDNKNDLLDLVVDHDSQLFTVIMTERMRNRRTTARVKTFTPQGDLIQDNIVNPGDRKSLLDAASTSFSNGLQYLAGTHSKRSPYYSQGFYLSKFINGVQQLNQYYPFADLNNFFSYHKPKREKRIKNRIERKRQKGKVKKFSYRLLVNEIIQREDDYIMVAEAYYPRYSYSSASAFSPYGGFGNFGNTGRGMQNWNPNFLGYKFTHAVVVGFDRNCNLLWDNTFKIEDIHSYTLDENVIVTASDDKVILSYLEENEIRSKVVEGNEIVEGRTFNPVRLSFDQDELRSKDPKGEDLSTWYGSTLFAYGRQSIKNENGVDGKVYRKVFYVNKIRFDFNREIN